MNIRILLTLLLASIALLTSCGDHSEPTPENTIYDRDPVKVTTNEVGYTVKGSSSTLSGTIQSKNKATVSARSMGYVASLKKEVGDRVTEGQTILTIKSNELLAKRAQVGAGIAEAEAALENVKINYDRIKVLWEQESITRKEWDDISAQYQMMQAKVEAARQKKNEIDEIIGHTTIKAPISGIVTAKMINRGDLVNPGVPLMTIEGNEGYEVVSYVADHQISAITMGMLVDCHIKAIDKTVKAKITEISPSAINTGGQFAVKAALQLTAEDKKAVFPGMYANMIADVPRYSSKEKCTTVEKSALIERGQLTGIYTISKQNTALLRWVRVGKDFGDRMEVVSGLSMGEEYIVGDLSRIADGIPVTKNAN